ncbi:MULTISPECIES: AAA family ATPase [Streptomyces]|uniref:MoxR family ATPase n=1 Tax=Streptomyces sudanensis TaxID=436397 RepID=A0ABY4THA7_9ACTN|nr:MULTISPECIES: MoxR family ATPase [Streptomyces]MCP9956444.1 MoxR family ATPase [Streptomyces sudanensis]MCQ0002944.1 MoxR family ATPase [Streptomyces sudanensis]URN17713.1 MoxR family ATPase [Streptomyces sudanensis]
MTWQPFYAGTGTPRERVELAPPPPWRVFPRRSLHEQFVPPRGLVEAVNAALVLRRPLLLTGPAGSGKSTVIEQVAAELELGPVLRWHITSRSGLGDALYRYDALGRIHAQRLEGTGGGDDIAPFLRMGPLGTALLPSRRPRALLVDEIDKSDLDLPSDLLDVLERGEFEIPELARYGRDVVAVREWGGDAHHEVTRGRVQCTEFPFIVMTSNGERDFPAAFLRRCIRFTMPKPTPETLLRVVAAHLGADAARSEAAGELVEAFVGRLTAGESLAVDQLLNAVHLLTGDGAPDGEQRQAVVELLLRELSRV